MNEHRVGTAMLEVESRRVSGGLIDFGDADRSAFRREEIGVSAAETAAPSRYDDYVF
jgi:hypothetical protein